MNQKPPSGFAGWFGGCLTGFCVAAAVPLSARADTPNPVLSPAPNTTIDTFAADVSPLSNSEPTAMYNAHLLVIQPNGAGGFIVGQTFLGGSNFSESLGDYVDFTGNFQLPRPNGVGNFGYAILGLYNPEKSPQDESGVTTGLSTPSGVLGTSWDKIFSTAATMTEDAAYNEINTSGDIDLGNLTVGFVSDLYNHSTQSVNAMGSTGGPSELDLDLVEFSDGTNGGTATLTAINAVPETGTWIAGVALLGVSGWNVIRRRKL